MPVPDAWEDVKNAGKALEQHGHPAGVVISHCLEANSTFWYVLWCYGGKILEEDGKTVAIKWIEAAAGYNTGPQRGYAQPPLWAHDPKITMVPTQLDFGRPYGWPARPGPAIGETDHTFVLPDMVAKVVSGVSIAEAMMWCEEQIAKIVKSHRT